MTLESYPTPSDDAFPAATRAVDSTPDELDEPLVDLTKALALADALEDEAILRKLSNGK